ncbi:glycosyltransferase [Calycomorphotria hydatis]|uniref:Glycosyl transferases group 1 n=1 Tax=Calycomorphotria hydatis TaxID=2528027 RepID=A0A517TED9_9PLAN|nr:glycosyltransferase [Calycomorphotria hydatis]QDT66736.1 Glycosyl transferases group 1 [Calycomorphotria hydatis]
MLTSALSNNTILSARLILYFTHPRDIGIAPPDFTLMINTLVHKVITMNSIHHNHLIEQGVDPNKIETILAGADPDMFSPRLNKTMRNDRKTVGLCLGFRDSKHYRERKDFDRIVETIKLLNNFNVILIGSNWKNYERFVELKSLSHFEYIDTSYQNYPGCYRRLDYFLSLSRLEGGPIPLLEAMMTNVFPIATATGMAPDIIKHGKNGLLLQTDVSPNEIRETVDQAAQMTSITDIRSTVLHHSWSNFCQKIANYALN